MSRASRPIRVDTNIPGGNAIIESVADSHVSIRPDIRDTRGSWFYWCFRVTECAGRDVAVKVGGEPLPVGVRGPAVSTDLGRSWRWLGSDAVHQGQFELPVPSDCDEVLFSFGMPYTSADLDRFLAELPDRDGHERAVLARSERGRRVELLRLGCTDGSAAARVLLTCRHHSCEMMASYVLEGVLTRVVAAEDVVGRWLRDHVEFVVVPFVDLDGVEDGDQGKNRIPHDHGRDYGQDEGRYAAVRAIQALLRDDSVRPFDVVLDLHCPNMAGPTNERIYFVGSPDQRNWGMVQELAAQLERVATGLPYRRVNDLAFGTAWNVAANFASRDEQRRPQQSIGLFCDDLPGVGMHAILEFPYANAEGSEVNAGSARAFGADIAAAIAAYLRTQLATTPGHLTT